MPHISIKPEVIFFFKGFGVTNSLLSTFIVLILFLLISLYYNAKNGTTSKFVFFVRFVTEKLYDAFKPILGNKIDEVFPIVASIFLFVLLSNWIGLLPGFGSIVINSPVHGAEVHESVPLLRGATADLNTTIALALIAFVTIQFLGFKYLGLSYLSKFFNFRSPMGFFTGILETISEFSKIISFAFRLFGNIFAGEVLLIVIAFLIPILASFPFLMLEVFVGFIQALVFAMLTAVFISVATTAHH